MNHRKNKVTQKDATFLRREYYAGPQDLLSCKSDLLKNKHKQIIKWCKPSKMSN